MIGQLNSPKGRQKIAKGMERFVEKNQLGNAVLKSLYLRDMQKRGTAVDI